MSALPAWFSIHPIDWKPAVGRLYDRPDGEHTRRERDMIRHIGIRPIIFSVNCYIAAVLALFISFSMDLKSSAWAMVTVYLTSQPLSGALRAKAVYRVVGTFVGGAVMVAIVPNLVNAPELTTLAIILWVALCVFVSLLDRTPRSYMFVLSGYTAALMGFPSVLAGLRADDPDQPRHRQPHNPAKNEGTVGIDNDSEIGRVARLQTHLNTEGQGECQTDRRISRNSHQEPGRDQRESKHCG